jgi:hypothetical protein
VSGELHVEGNWIGFAPDKSVVGNQTGILVDGGSSDIGGVNGAATRNVIGGGRVGVLIRAGNNTRLRGNYIGTAPDGITAAGNNVHGVSIFGTVSNTMIGGMHPVGGFAAPNSPANVIAANTNAGIILQDTQTGAPANTSILGNIIGLGVDGSDLGNRDGVVVRNSPGTRIGMPGGGNVISGNGTSTVIGNGVNVLSGLALNSSPLIQSNYIGLDLTGLVARPNTGQGITASAPANIGGSGVGEGNFISGNGQILPSPTTGPNGYAGNGLLIIGTYSGTVVTGNTIGLNTAGAAVPNAFSGITIAGTTGTTIGGSAAGQGNVISGNGRRGISFSTLSTNNVLSVPTNTVVKGNRIGTDAAGNVAGVGNGGAGIFAVGTSVLIGGSGPGDANIIAGNLTDPVLLGSAIGGVVVSNGGAPGTVPNSQISIVSNQIHANAGLGIDILGDSNGNDPGDTDTGANGLINRAEIRAAVNTLPAVNQGYLSVKLDSQPGTYDMQVFSNAACDASGFGEGQTLLFDTQVTITTNPLRTILVTNALTPGMFLSVTVRDAAGNTSEFSNCTTVQQTNAYYSNPSSAGGTGNFYEYVLGGNSWGGANAAAQGRSVVGRPGHLVTITSAVEQGIVQNLRVQMGLGDMRAWIGLYDPSGSNTWQWVTGEPLTYTNWGGGEPNNIGSERWTEFFASGAWNNNTEFFGGNQGYVVEYEPEVVVGGLLDAVGDAGSYMDGPVGPIAGADLVSVKALRRGSDMVFQVQFASGFDPATTQIQLMLDTDSNPATGHPGVNAGCQQDANVIGPDYTVQINFGATPNLLRFTGCNQLQFIGSVPVQTLTSGYEVTVPLSVIGNDDGVMAFKVATSSRLTSSQNANSGILDYITNVGVAPGVTSGGGN